MAVGTMIARMSLNMTPADMRGGAIENPSNEKGIELYTPDQDEPVRRIEPGKKVTSEHLAVFTPYEKDALLEKKKEGWESPIRASGQGFEWDHFAVTMTTGMTQYFDDPAKTEERDRYRQAIIEGLREVEMDKGGQTIEARKSMMVGDWHTDTPNHHFDVYLHRHAVSVADKYIAPAERITTNDELTRMQSRLNTALERHGFSKDFYVEIEAGANMNAKTKSAERVQAQEQKLSTAWAQRGQESTPEAEGPAQTQEDPRRVVDELIKEAGGEPVLSPTAKPLSEMTITPLLFTQGAEADLAEAARLEEKRQGLIARAAAQQQAAAVHLKNEALTVENGNLLDNVEALKIEKGEILETLNATKEELVESQAAYQELNEIATDQAKELEGAYSQVEALTQTVEVQSKDIEALTADKASLAGQLNKTEHKLDVANRSIQDLQIMVEEADKDRLVALDQVKEKDVEIGALTDDLTDARATIEAQAGEISLLTTEIGAVRNLAQEQEKALGQTKEALGQAQTERDQALGQVKELGQENGSLKEELGKAGAELSQARALVVNLETRLESAVQARDMMKDNLDAQKGLVAAKDAALEGKDKTIADLEARLAAMEARMQEQQTQEQERPQASKALHEVLSGQLQAVIVKEVLEPDYPAKVGVDKNGDDVWMTRNKSTQVTAYAVTSAKTGEVKTIAGEEKAQTVIKDQLENRNREKEQERAQARERESRGGGGMER